VRDILGSVGEVYRRGGDEIVVLAPELGIQDAHKLAEKVRVEVEQRFQKWEGKMIDAPPHC